MKQSIQPNNHPSVIQNFFIYVFGALCLGGFSILLAPINMRILSPHDYGVIALINSCISVGVTILGLGLRQFLSIEYFHHDTAGQKKLINQILGYCGLVNFKPWSFTRKFNSVPGIQGSSSENVTFIQTRRRGTLYIVEMDQDAHN